MKPDKPFFVSLSFFFLFTIQCRVYVRIILLRNKKAISSEVSVGTNGTMTLSQFQILILSTIRVFLLLERSFVVS